MEEEYLRIDREVRSQRAHSLWFLIRRRLDLIILSQHTISQYLSNWTQTDGRTKGRNVRPSVRSFVCLFVRCVCQGRPSYGERTAMLHRSLMGEERNQNPGSTNIYTKFGQLIIRKIIKNTAISCHILRLKCTKLYSRRLSVHRWHYAAVLGAGPSVTQNSPFLP